MRRIDLDHVPVRIANIDLREAGHGASRDDHAVWIAALRVLPVPLAAQKLDHSFILRHAQREMNIARIERFVAEGRGRMHDQVHVLSGAQLKPGPREIEWRPGDFLERQDFAVKSSGSLQILDGESDMVERGALHILQRGTQPSPASSKIT